MTKFALWLLFTFGVLLGGLIGPAMGIWIKTTPGQFGAVSVSLVGVSLLVIGTYLRQGVSRP